MAIDDELGRLRKDGDTAPSSFADEDSDCENSTPPTYNNVFCDGYLNNFGDKQCLAHCDGLLRFETSTETTRHFCKASHMMRYLVKHFTGKRTKKARKS